MKLNSKSINYNVQTVDELVSLDGLEGDTVVVTDEDRGGVFVYREDNVGTNNGGTIFNGWTRQYDGAVNVKWFGAVGDGVTDDTEAIQSVLNLYKDVYVPSGVYLISSIYIKNGSIIHGVSKGRSWDSSAITTFKQISNSSSHALIIDISCKSFVLENIFINGNKDNQVSSNHGIYYYPDSSGDRECSGTISNVRVAYTKGTGIYQSLNRNGTQYKNINIYGCGGDGIFLGASDNNLSSCAIGGNTGIGIKIGNWTNSITDCDIWDNANGIFLDGNSAYYIDIKGCKFDLNRGSSIYCNNSTSYPAHISITNCSFHNTAATSLQPQISLNANYAICSNNKFGSQNDGTTPAYISYDIYVPTGAIDKTHSIIGNERYNSSLYGMLAYRGDTSMSYYFGATTYFSRVNTIKVIRTKTAAPATSGLVTLDLTTASIFTITPTDHITLNSSNGVAGQKVDLIILTSGTTSWTITGGGTCKTAGSLSTGTTSGKYFIMTFIFDGTYLIETSRTIAI